MTGGQTRASMELLGRGALLRVAGSFNLTMWLFGALLASEIVKRPKLAFYIAPIFVSLSLLYKLGGLNFMKAFTWYRYIGGNYAVVLVTIVFSSMFFGKYLAEKGKIR